MNQIKDQWDSRQKELGNTNRAVLFKNFPASFNQKLHQEHLEFISKNLPDNPASILDVGCGYGRLSLPLKENLPDTEFNGVELCDEFAHSYIANVGACYTGSLVDFKTDKQYDAILLVTVLMYLSPAERKDALKKLWDCLAPRGKLILIEPYYNFLTAWRRRLQLSYFSPTGGEVKYFRRSEFENILRENLLDSNLIVTKFFNMPYTFFPRLHIGLVLEKSSHNIHKD
tara:strand:+ start:3080 stop:3763 length:684 start_codon:yes stop_codon:yes gene_type:complete